MTKNKTIWMVSNLSDRLFLPYNVARVGQVQELPENPPYAIVLSKTTQQRWPDLVAELRAKRNYRYIPVFYHGTIENQDKCLFDGSADENVLTIAHYIYRQLEKLSPFILEKDELEYKLLCYLYTRPEYKLRGIVNPLDAKVYEYPLLTVLNSEKIAIDQGLFTEDLVLRELLRPNGLIDEIKICNQCHSGLLNVKNLCPACHSVDVKKQELIHCLSCDKTGIFVSFLRQGTLVCNQCGKALEELGTDYEKPPQNNLCSRCGLTFAKPITRLCCLVCQHISPIEELISQQIFDYSLTRRAEYLVQGLEKELFQNFQRYFNVIDYIEFMSIIAWQMKLCERYQSNYFAIMTLKILNEAELIEEKGSVSTERIIGKFFNDLRQVFRESDLSSRAEGTMFFFLPMTEAEGCQALTERIKRYLNKKEKENSELSISLNYLVSSEIINGHLDSGMLTSELQARMYTDNLLASGKNNGPGGN